MTSVKIRSVIYTNPLSLIFSRPPRQIQYGQHQRHGRQEAEDVPLRSKPLGEEGRDGAAVGAVQEVKVRAPHLI